MATTTIAALLQAALALLSGVKAAGPAMAPETAQKAINIAGNAVQMATQVLEPIGFPVARNSGIWPNMQDLAKAPYRAAGGSWTRLHAGGANDVQLVESATSFGDLNHDGIDDAAVVLKKEMPGGGNKYFIAAMLNQGGTMFDIRELPLANTFEPTTVAHDIAGGDIILKGKHYRLIGNELEVL